MKTPLAVIVIPPTCPRLLVQNAMIAITLVMVEEAVIKTNGKHPRISLVL
jgi:hypothetical protein